MVYMRLAGGCMNDLDDIETENVFRKAVTQPPYLRDAAERLSLSPSDRFASLAVAVAAAGLYFDEGHQRAAARDQIEIVATHPESVGQDLPALGDQIVDRLRFAVEAQAVAGIGPSIGRDGWAAGHLNEDRTQRSTRRRRLPRETAGETRAWGCQRSGVSRYLR